MIFYIVRHGRPDYETNTLLPEGQAQAEAVGERLAHLPIDRIYSSPYGRAVQTAEPLARRLNLPIRIEPWAYELEEESHVLQPDGTYKLLVKYPGTYFHDERFRALSVEESFDAVEIFSPSFRERYHAITAGLDDLLARNGYRRNEKGLYEVTNGSRDYVVLFCHAGMTRVMLSHLLHVPYQVFAATVLVPFTGVTTLYFPEEPDETGCVMPVIHSIGDFGHLSTGDEPYTFPSGKRI